MTTDKKHRIINKVICPKCATALKCGYYSTEEVDYFYLYCNNCDYETNSHETITKCIEEIESTLYD